MSSAQQKASGPPYVPTVALLGLTPTSTVDIPISAVLIAFFLCSAVANFTIFRRNQARAHKFIPSMVLFGFSMARTAALVLRIVWAERLTNASLGIAAMILASAGTVILFVINLILAQRVLRSLHPRFGWHRVPSFAFMFLYFCVVACLIMTIVPTVLTFYTLDASVRQKARQIQLFSGTYLALLAFLPIPIVGLAAAFPKSGKPEPFGSGSLRTKMVLVLGTAALLTLGAGFRIGVNFTTPRLASNPAWYHQKACYYVFNYVLEIIVVYTYTLSRFDRRFYVPNGAKGPGDYAAGFTMQHAESQNTNDFTESAIKRDFA
ncbi:hypothetical protein CCHR01_01960 [Colletotrichum chrysophilum]|uniref:Family c-likeg-protein-coupled receptor protein n=1 Tax=Colletotrichum chrysophilum TaxID=1836956 RepID=A0AAD9AXW5_9PEZI|nr:hypothetical protein CCHR01_01960 [Colletotrichum chrysophilum]